LDASDRVRERAAAVREAHLERRQTLQHAAEDEAARRARLLGRHADEPRQPVLRHRVAAHHVPRMHEDRGAEIGSGLEEWEELGRVEIEALAVRTDLHALKAQLLDAAL